MSALSQLIQLRRQQEQLAAEIKELEAQAIQEAMTAISETNRKTFTHEGVQVQLRFTTVRPKPKDDPELEYLDLEIKRLKATQYQKHQETIKDMQAKIDVLKIEIEGLITTQEVEHLQQEFNTLADAKATQQTILALSF